MLKQVRVSESLYDKLQKIKEIKGWSMRYCLDKLTEDVKPTDFNETQVIALKVKEGK